MSSILEKNNWDSPVWIIGNPRSGTSLYRIMLHAHPDVNIPPESHFFLWLEPKFAGWKSEDGLENFLDALYESTKFETWKLDRCWLKAFLQDNNPASFAQLIALVYIAFGISQKKKARFWGDKNKLWKDKLPVVRANFPETRFIHVVRDGRDVACSFKELNRKAMSSKYAPKLPEDISMIAERWKRNIRGILAFQETSDNAHFMTLRYEDLLTSTEEVIRKSCEWLGIGFLEGQLEYYRETDKARIEPEEFFQWKEKLLSPPDISNMGKYKHELSEEEIAIFNEICSDELKHFNYL